MFLSRYGTLENSLPPSRDHAWPFPLCDLLVAAVSELYHQLNFLVKISHNCFRIQAHKTTDKEGLEEKRRKKGNQSRTLRQCTWGLQDTESSKQTDSRFRIP